MSFENQSGYKTHQLATPQPSHSYNQKIPNTNINSLKEKTNCSNLVDSKEDKNGLIDTAFTPIKLNANKYENQGHLMQNQQYFQTPQPQTKVDPQSQEKHEQRRLNLKRKRARDQLMQVVEDFIRDQTILTAYQSFVEVNFDNDIQNCHHEIIESALSHSLRGIIQEILKDIYVANTASLLMESVIVIDINSIVGEICIPLLEKQEEEKYQKSTESGWQLMEQSQVEQDQLLMDSVLSNEFVVNTCLNSHIQSSATESEDQQTYNIEYTGLQEEISLNIANQTFYNNSTSQQFQSQQSHNQNFIISTHMTSQALVEGNINLYQDELACVDNQTTNEQDQNLVIEQKIEGQVTINQGQQDLDLYNRLLNYNDTQNDVKSDINDTQIGQILIEIAENDLQCMRNTTVDNLVQDNDNQLVNENNDSSIDEQYTNTIIEQPALKNDFLYGLIMEVLNECQAELTAEDNEIIAEGVSETILKKQIEEQIIGMTQKQLFEAEMEKFIATDQYVEEKLINSALQTMICDEVAEQVAHQIDVENIAIEQQTNQIVNEIVQDLTLETCQQGLEYLRNIKAQMDTLISDINMAIVEDVVENQVQEIISTEIQSELLTQSIFETLILSTLKDLVKNQIDSNIIQLESTHQILNNAITQLIMGNIQQELTIQAEIPGIILADISESVISQTLKALVSESYQTQNNKVNSLIEQTQESVVKHLLSESLNEQLINNDLYDEILGQIIQKDMIYPIKTGQDVSQISSIIEDNTMQAIIRGLLKNTIISEFKQYPINSRSNKIQQTNTCLSQDSEQALLIEEIREYLIQDVMISCLGEIVIQTINNYIVQPQNPKSKTVNNKIDSSQDLSLQQQSSSKRANQDQIHLQQLQKKQEGIEQQHQFEKASKQCAQAFMNKFLNEQIRKDVIPETKIHIAAELVMEKFLSKSIKRSLYKVIQTSVDTIYNIEEDTIALANNVLDNFILGQIDKIICQELVTTEDALSASSLIIETVIEKDISDISQGIIKKWQNQGNNKNQISRKYKDAIQNKKQEIINRYVAHNQSSSDSSQSRETEVLSDDEGHHQLIKESLLSPNRAPSFHSKCLSVSKSSENPTLYLQKQYYAPSIMHSQKYSNMISENQEQNYSNPLILTKESNFGTIQSQTIKSYNGKGSKSQDKSQGNTSKSPASTIYYQANYFSKGGVSKGDNTTLQGVSRMTDDEVFISARSSSSQLQGRSRSSNQIIKGGTNLCSDDELDEDKLGDFTGIVSNTDYKQNLGKGIQPRNGFGNSQVKGNKLENKFMELQNLQNHQNAQNQQQKLGHQVSPCQYQGTQISQLQNYQTQFVQHKQSCHRLKNEIPHGFNNSLANSRSLKNISSQNQTSCNCQNMACRATQNLVPPYYSTLNLNHQNPSCSSPHFNHASKPQTQQQIFQSQIGILNENLIQKYMEIKKCNKHSIQLQYLETLQLLTTDIMESRTKMERLYEIDQHLKNILQTISNNPMQHQECFNIILFANQLAILNYQKLQQLADSNINSYSNLSGYQNKKENSQSYIMSPYQGGHNDINKVMGAEMTPMATRNHSNHKIYNRNGQNINSSSTTQQPSQRYKQKYPQQLAKKTKSLNTSTIKTSRSTQSLTGSSHQATKRQQHLFNHQDINNTIVSAFNETAKFKPQLLQQVQHSSHTKLDNNYDVRNSSCNWTGPKAVVLGEQSMQSNFQKEIHQQHQQQQQQQEQKYPAQLSQLPICLKSFTQNDQNYLETIIRQYDNAINNNDQTSSKTQSYCSAPSIIQGINSIGKNGFYGGPSMQTMMVGESKSDFEKRQFYLMALYQVMCNPHKIRIKDQSLSVEDIYLQHKICRIMPKDWKLFINGQLKHQIEATQKYQQPQYYNHQ